MPKFSAGVGDRFEVGNRHRLAGEQGVVVAVGDNPHANQPFDSFHVRFDRRVRGTCGVGEVWLSSNDFTVIEKAPKGYTPPDDIVKAADAGFDD